MASKRAFTKLGGLQRHQPAGAMVHALKSPRVHVLAVENRALTGGAAASLSDNGGGQQIRSMQQHQHGHKGDENRKLNYARLLSFATADAHADLAVLADRYRKSYFNGMETSPERSGEAAYSLSNSTPFSDFSTAQLLTSSMDSQLREASSSSDEMDPLVSVATADARRTLALLEEHQLHHDQAAAEREEAESTTVHSEGTDGSDGLPRTFEEALRPSSQARVITSIDPPFEIVDVNASWEGLCGYTKDESVGKSLGMLQGPETDKTAVTALLSQLMKGEEAYAVLTNYTKEGRRFKNRLHVGPIRDGEDKRITHFIGVLQEVSDARSSSSILA